MVKRLPGVFLIEGLLWFLAQREPKQYCCYIGFVHKLGKATVNLQYFSFSFRAKGCENITIGKI